MQFNPLPNGDIQIILNINAVLKTTITLSKPDINELRGIMDKQARLEKAEHYANLYLCSLPVPGKKRVKAQITEAKRDQIERISEKFCDAKSETVPDNIIWERIAKDVMLDYITTEWLGELEYDLWNNGPTVKNVVQAFAQRGFSDPDLSEDMTPDELTQYLKTIIVAERKISVNRLIEIMLDKIWR